MIPERTTVDNMPGVAFSSQVDQAVQYREAFFTLYRLFIDAGWPMILTSGLNNGAGMAADATDNLEVATDVVFGSAGTQNMSYFAVRGPRDIEANGDNFGHPSDDGDFYMLFVANNSNADTTPQNVDVYMSRSTYSLAGTPTQNRPTTAGAETTVFAYNIIPWASVVTAQYNTWRNSYGELLFAVKNVGSPNFRGGFMIRSPADGTDLANRAIFWLNAQGTDADCFTTTLLVSTSTWRGFRLDAAVSTVNPITTSRFWQLAPAWPDGKDERGQTPRANVAVGINGSTTAQSRYFGRLVDVKGVPPNTAFNSSDDTDVSDTMRWRSIGAIAVPCTRAAGAIT